MIVVNRYEISSQLYRVKPIDSFDALVSLVPIDEELNETGEKFKILRSDFYADYIVIEQL